MTRYLPTMLKVGAIKFKRVKSSRRLDVFNPTTNKLLNEHRASLKKGKEVGGVRG